MASGGTASACPPTRLASRSRSRAKVAPGPEGPIRQAALVWRAVLPTDMSLTGAQALIRTLVDAGVDDVLRQPRHVGDALRRRARPVPEMRAVLGLFEGVATGAADGYARMAAARGDAAAPRAGPGQRAGEPAQRAPRQGRRWSTSSATTPPTTRSTTRRCSPTSSGRAQRLGLGADLDEHRTTAPATRSRRCRRHGPAGAGRDADPARGRVVERGSRALPPSVPPAPPHRPSRRGEVDRTRRMRNGGSRPGSCSAAGRCVSRAWSPPRGSRPRPAPSCSPRRSRRAWSAAPVCPPSSGSRMCPSSPRPSSSGLKHLVLVDAKAPVSFFAYPGKTSYLVPDGCEVHDARAAGRRRGRERSRRSRTRSARTARSRRCRGEPPRRRPPGRSRPTRSPRPSARSCPRARSSPTRRSRRARCSRRTLPEHPGTIG